MSTFICEKCGHIDNSSCGGTCHSAGSGMNFYADDYANNHKLCVECTPKEYSDGSINEDAGKWHNHFPKRHWTALGKEKILKLWAQKQGDVINAPEYFANEFMNDIKKEVGDSK